MSSKTARKLEVVSPVPADIDIANSVEPLHISDIAQCLYLSPNHYDLYGKYKAKVTTFYPTFSTSFLLFYFCFSYHSLDSTSDSLFFKWIFGFIVGGNIHPSVAFVFPCLCISVIHLFRLEFSQWNHAFWKNLIIVVIKMKVSSMYLGSAGLPVCGMQIYSR